MNNSDLINSLDIGGETTMDTEDRSINDSTQREIIEDFSEIVPGVDVTVLSQDFIVETVSLSGLSGFVITSEEGDALRVLSLQTKKIFNSFNGIVTSINEITDENVFVLGKITTLAE